MSTLILKPIPFSAYRNLKVVLGHYNIYSSRTDAIPLFFPPILEIQEKNKHFEHCIEDILFRLKYNGSLNLNGFTSTRKEYVSTILYTALHIIDDINCKEFSVESEYEITGVESSGRIDYVIKEAENILCVIRDKAQSNIPEGFAQTIKQLETSYETNKLKRGDDDGFDYLYGVVTSGRDWHFLLYSPGEISQISEVPFTIEFNKAALDKNSDAYQSLRNGVKKVLGIIVGLLKDRACVEEDSHSKKKARIEEYRSKNN